MKNSLTFCFLGLFFNFEDRQQFENPQFMSWVYPCFWAVCPKTWVDCPGFWEFGQVLKLHLLFCGQKCSVPQNTLIIFSLPHMQAKSWHSKKDKVPGGSSNHSNISPWPLPERFHCRCRCFLYWTFSRFTMGPEDSTKL